MANWIKMHQQGAAITQQDPMEQIVALVQAAMGGNQQAQQQIQQIQQAAQQGDSQAQQIMQMIQEVMQSQTPSQKCGGKAKKKPRLKREGSKLQEIVQKKSTGGCSCKKHLMRKGGRIVNVDCTGRIV